jgi:PAS domain S-box-containing protein
MKILIVEDEGLVAEDIVQSLRDIGYETGEALDTGEEAVKLAASIAPDLILMDIRLRGRMDGVEAAKQIRAVLDIPIVFLSAYSDQGLLNMAKEAAPSGYLLKPFNKRELHTTIEMALHKHKLEKQLKEKHRWLATLLEHIGDGVVANDSRGAVTFMNPAAELLTGWKKEEAVGRGVAEIFNVVDECTYEPMDNPAMQALQQGVKVVLSEGALLIGKNAEEVPVCDSAAPILDEHGNLEGSVLVFRDDAQRRRKEYERLSEERTHHLQVQLEAIKRLDALKDEFLSTVSHELRTPIANMKLALKMIKDKTNPQRHDYYLSILEQECQREMKLVNDLLYLQSIGQDNNWLPPVTLNLQEWLPPLIEPFRARTHMNLQVLEFSIPESLPPFASDAAALERIVSELMNNACKYTPEQGMILLQVEPGAMQMDEVQSVLFRFTNTCADIAESELANIFKKFYRILGSDPNAQSGTGLGLALVKTLVERLGGTILVESNLGRTCFTVELPTHR